MPEIEQLLLVMEDARLESNATALVRLGRELATQLGVAEAGGDEYGLWCRFEVTGDDGNTASQRMRWLWPGRFVMGSPDDEVGRLDWEGPQHSVVLTRGLWMGETAVTVALYTAVTGHSPSRFTGDDCPVEWVSWHDAVAMCEALSVRLPRLRPRLPTEAEWEYAARAGTATATYNGDLDDIAQCPAVLDAIAWYKGNSSVDGERCTHRVGQLSPNAWGLYDMLGNVLEWCADHTELQPYALGTAYDPLCTTGSHRVFRGGSWSGDAQLARAASRYADDPGHAHVIIGFRLAGGAPGSGAQVPRDGASEAGTARSEP